MVGKELLMVTFSPLLDEMLQASTQPAECNLVIFLWLTTNVPSKLCACAHRSRDERT